MFIEDRPTRLTGTERHFETAELKPGKAYTYTVQVETSPDSPRQSKRVTVHAGETVAVRFESGK